MAPHPPPPFLRIPTASAALQPSFRPPTPIKPELMPLPHRVRGSRLAGSRVASTSLSRATAHSPRRVSGGAPRSSHAQRLTQQRHPSKQVPPAQSDFRLENFLPELAGGDTGDSRQTPSTKMDSGHRSVHAVSLGRAARSSRDRTSSAFAQRDPTVPAYRLASPRSSGPLGTDRFATVLFRALPRRDWTKLRWWARDGVSSDWSVALIGRSHCHSVVSLQPGQL